MPPLKPLTIFTGSPNKSITSSSSRISRSSRSSRTSNVNISSDTSLSSRISSRGSIIQSLNLREPLYRSLLNKYIDLIISEKSREDVSQKVLKRMKSAFLNIYNELTNPRNYMTTNMKQRDYKYMSSRERKVKLLTGYDKTYITELLTSKATNTKTTAINYPRKSTSFLKVYKTMDISSINEFYGIAMKIVSEIYFNRRAYDIRKKCGFILPKIFKFGIIKDPERDNIVEIYILMEYVYLKNFNSMISIRDDNTMLDFFKKLYKINKCLEANNIYHNDIHEENVYYSYSARDTIGDILLIDYGESLARQDRLDDEKLQKLFERFLPGHDFKTSIVDNYKTASGTRKKRRRRLKLSKPTRRRR